MFFHELRQAYYCADNFAAFHSALRCVEMEAMERCYQLKDRNLLTKHLLLGIKSDAERNRRHHSFILQAEWIVCAEIRHCYWRELKSLPKWDQVNYNEFVAAVERLWLEMKTPGHEKEL